MVQLHDPSRGGGQREVQNYNSGYHMVTSYAADGGPVFLPASPTGLLVLLEEDLAGARDGNQLNGARPSRAFPRGTLNATPRTSRDDHATPWDLSPVVDSREPASLT
jgi:hypothetical protein